MKGADNEWHLRAAATHDERIAEMICVEQKVLCAVMVDGTMKRLADDDRLQFELIGFRNRSGNAKKKKLD